MASSLAVPTFVSGARDDLAAVDVYTRTDDSVINNTPNVLSTPSLSTMNSLRGGATAMAGVPGLDKNAGFAGSISSLTSGLNTGSISSLVSSASSKGISAVSSLVTSVGGSMGPSVANALRSLSPAIAQAVSAKMNSNLPTMSGANTLSSLGSVINFAGKSQQIAPGNLASANSLISSVTSLSGSSFSSGTNMNAVSGLISGLVSQASKLGISGVFTQLKPLTSSPAQVTAVVRSSLPDVISNSDISTMKEFSVEPGVIPMVNSSAITDFSGAFQPSVPYTSADYTQSFGDIKTTFSNIDPTWNQYERQTGTTTDPNTGAIIPTIDTSVDLTTTLNGSAEFKKTMATGAMASTDPTDKTFLIAQAYVAPDPQKQLAAVYPLAAAQVAVNPVPVNEDPRTTTQLYPSNTDDWVQVSDVKSMGYNGHPEYSVEVITANQVTHNSDGTSTVIQKVTTIVFDTSSTSTLPLSKKVQYIDQALVGIT